VWLRRRLALTPLFVSWLHHYCTDFTAWGWVHMILGVIMILTSAGLLMGRDGRV
jgi:hypothetical protein